MTVAELGVRMSAHELGQWQGLYRAEAIERQREEERAERRMRGR